MRLLDLFCGAGGAAMGYYRAGFAEIVGVDIVHQPRYPFEFVQADALEYVVVHGHEFDVIHASPPCQRYSKLAYAPGRNMSSYGDLIHPTRQALVAIGKPWVLENVVGAPLNTCIELCGTMFGLRVYRHRRFESSLLLFQPHHRRHTERIKPRGRGKLLGYYSNQVGEMVTVAGHMFSLAAGQAAMDIDWMQKNELAEAIPPAYTEWIGQQLLAGIRTKATQSNRRMEPTKRIAAL